MFSRNQTRDLILIHYLMYKYWQHVFFFTYTFFLLFSPTKIKTNNKQQRRTHAWIRERPQGRAQPLSHSILRKISLLELLKGYVHIIQDSFCASTKIIPDRVSVHTQILKWFWRRDFCGEEKKLPRRYLKWRVRYRIRDHTIPDGFSSRHEKLSGRVWP